MHSVLGRRGRRWPDRFMRGPGTRSQKPVPDAGFLLIFRLFLSVVIDRDWRTYLDRKVVPLRLFLRAVGDDPVRLQGALIRGRVDWTMSACCIWSPSSSRSARSVDHLSAAVFLRRHQGDAARPPLAVWALAAALEMVDVATGWTVIDEFARASSISIPAICLPRMCSRCPTGAGATGVSAGRIGAVDTS